MATVKPMTSNSITVMSFEETKIPKFIEKTGKDWVLYGENNQYPQELITMFNRSAKHNAIVTGKSEYIIGKGLQPVNELQKTQYEAAEKLIFGERGANDFLYKISLDLELFNGYAIEMIPTLDKKRWTANHIDFSKIRSNKDGSKFYFSEDWSKFSQDEKTGFEEYRPFVENVYEKSIIYFKSYRPKSGLDTYPLPDYIGCMAYIECDYQISNFHVNNLRNGFTGATIINFFTGEPTQEEQKAIERKLKKKFAGTDNAGGIVLVFSDAKSKEPRIENILPSDFDKQFDILNKTVQQEIFTGHKVTSPMLFGIKTEGQLGGRSELVEAYEMFENVYIRQRREKLLATINRLFKMYGVTEIDFVSLEPIGFSFSEAVMAQNMSREEIRNLIKNQGIQLEDEKVIASANKTVDAINSLYPLVANNVLSVLTPNELRGLIGMPPEAGGDAIKEAAPVGVPMCSDFSEEKTDEEVLSVFSKYGRPAQEFTVIKTKYVHRRKSLSFSQDEHLFIKVSNTEAKVLSLINSNPLISVNEVAAALKIGTDEASAIMHEIISKDLVQVDEASGKIRVSEIGDKALRDKKVVKISSMYKYGLNPYVTGKPIIPTTREFCERLIQLDRMYTRNDLNKISEEVGYNVWTRRGGFYHNPTTNITTPFCRHIWELKIVTEK